MYTMSFQICYFAILRSCICYLHVSARLLLVRRPARTYRVSILCGTALLGLALTFMKLSGSVTTTASAYLGFACALLVWAWLEITFLTGVRNRLGAMLTWWLAFTRDVRRERTFTTQQIATLHDVYASPLGPIDPEQAAAAPDSAPDKPTAQRG